MIKQEAFQFAAEKTKRILASWFSTYTRGFQLLMKVVHFIRPLLQVIIDRQEAQTAHVH